MKAISLHQPWASAMAMGLKRNETRGRLTHYRGDLVICSAKRPMDQNGLALARTHGMSLFAMKFGCALCIVEVYNCVPTEDFVRRDNTIPPRKISAVEYALGDYSAGRFAWLTRNLRVLKTPVPVHGKQGFINLPPDVVEKIKAQL